MIGRALIALLAHDVGQAGTLASVRIADSAVRAVGPKDIAHTFSTLLLRRITIESLVTDATIRASRVV